MVRYILGYVKISVKSPFKERFINILSRRAINFWDVEETGPNELVLKMRARDYKKIRPLAKASMSRVHIIKKSGLYFLWRSYAKRQGLIIGFVMCLFVLWYSTSFVWSVELYNPTLISDETIYAMLDEMGVKKGARSSKINKDFIRNEMLMRSDELSWVGINIVGTKALVEVRQRTKAPEIIADDVPCNIVARRDGFIKKLEVLNGVAKVYAKTSVKKGDLLVSGVYESEGQKTRYVHSMASVLAQTSYVYKDEISLIEEIKVYTGREKTLISLDIFGKMINFFVKNAIDFEKYDKITKEEKISFASGAPLPVKIIKSTYIEYISEMSALPEMLAERRAIDSANARMKTENAQAVITDINFLCEVFGDVMYASVTFTCDEDIAQKEIIFY